MSLHSNLILIGYRGTGKTTVARALAKTLQLPLVSLDDEIVRRGGCSISDLVQSNGWEYFRDLEQTLVVEYTIRNGIILDCGGGVVERPANTARLRSGGTVFWLTASTQKIVERIERGTDRPALTANLSFTEEVESVLRRRNPLYASTAHVKIDTEQAQPEAVARQIVQLWPALGQDQD